MRTVFRATRILLLLALGTAVCAATAGATTPGGQEHRRPCLYDDELLGLLSKRWQEFQGDLDARSAASDIFLNAVLSDTTCTLSFFHHNKPFFDEWLAGLDNLTFFNQRVCSRHLCNLDTFIEDLDDW